MADERYIYGLIACDDERLEFGSIGLQGCRVFTVPWNGLAGVVSESPEKEYVADHENLKAHASVLEEVGKKHSILPMRFDTIAGSEKNIRQFLKLHRREIIRLLKRLSGKLEVELEILWKDMKSIFSKIASSNATLMRLKALNRPVTRDEQMMAGALVSRLLHTLKEEERKKFIGRFVKLAEDYNVMPSPIDEMIANVSFLVDTAKLKTFDEAVDKLSDEVEETMRIRYIGPIAPMSFAHLRMK